MSVGADIAAFAERVIDVVRSTTGGRAEAEVIVDHTDMALTRFANSFIHQNVAESGTSMRLRLHLDGRTANGATTRIAGDGIESLVERTIAASRLLPVDPGWAGLSPPAPTTTSGNVDPATTEVTPAGRASIVAAFVEAAAGLETAGFCQTVHSTASFANSAGQFLSGVSTQATLDGIARTGSSDGAAHLVSNRLGDVDGAALGARAADKARSSADPVELPPGDYEVVLEPFPVADILLGLAIYGFNGRAVNEGRSFVKVGERQFDKAVTLIDDATAPEALGLPFDAEGTPKRRFPLIDGGITVAVAHDRRTAKEAGAETTGHAIPGGETFGAAPTDVRLSPGPADVTVDDLIAGVERGILVTDFNYTRVLDPRTVVVTGLTRNGVWLIEGGQPTTAVKNFRFTQSYPAALAPGAVLGVAGRAEFAPTELEGLAYAGPALRLAAWHFTGGASG